MAEWNEREPREARTMNRKKKTGKWCKGKAGVEHVTEIVVNHNVVRPSCQWVRTWLYRSMQGPGVHTWRWSCSHATRCVNCGKYIQYLGLGKDCPDYVERTDDH